MKDKNKALVDLAVECEGSFVWFLVGWMGENHHQQMAECARAWLEAHDPKQLTEFDEKNSQKVLDATV